MSRIVDVSVSVPELRDESGAVTRDGKDYGTFKARIRDYDTMLFIELKVDSLITERKMDLDSVSRDTRSHFYLLATLAITCDKAPDGFKATDLMDGDPTDSIAFLVAYSNALSEMEARFRKGGTAPSAPVTLV